jgi:6-phosphogluconolactonase (cycloisomerase 2 family)
MKRILVINSICLLMNQVAFSASPGHLFRTTAQGATLTVNSTIPNWTYPHAGISSSQSGVSFSGCTNNSNGQCIFSVSDTQSASLTITGATTPIVVRLCLDGYGNTYNCENVTVQLTSNAYVTNYDTGTISLCSVDSTTGTISSNCTTAASGFTTPRRIVLNSAGTLAYVVDESGGSNGGIRLCQVNATTGLLTSCVQAAAFTAASDLVFSPSGTRAYVTDVTDGTISKCSVNTTTGALSDCHSILSSGVPTTGMALNPAGTIAYYAIAYPTNTITYCSVNQVTGLLSNCLTTGSGFSFPEAVTLNAAGTHAYISNNALGNISVCRVDTNTGAFISCSYTAGGSFSGRGGVEFNSTGTLAYVPNFNTNLVYKCNVDASTGHLSGCVDSGGATFSDPSGLNFVNY